MEISGLELLEAFRNLMEQLGQTIQQMTMQGFIALIQLFKIQMVIFGLQVLEEELQSLMEILRGQIILLKTVV